MMARVSCESPHYHSIVWIDHHKAVVWNFSDDEQTKSVVRAHDQHEHTHLHKSPHGGHRSEGNHEFFGDVTQSLEGAHELLIIGPAQAKEELAAFLRIQHRDIGSSIVGVESADHPTDAESLAYARRHFKGIDRMI
jgi:stalled ribosome rescue protein Dom34